MDLLTFNLASSHQHGPAFYNYLKLRKRHFVDVLNWDIPHDEMVEMDQYDTPQAWYACVAQNGQVIGGARVMPTTATWGAHSYMLGDAYHGHIPGIPQDAMPRNIRTTKVWECTRLVITPDLRKRDIRARCLELICNGLISIAHMHGATDLITLTRMPLMRTLRSLGFDVTAVGAPYTSPEDGHRYAVMGMPAVLNHTALAAE